MNVHYMILFLLFPLVISQVFMIFSNSECFSNEHVGENADLEDQESTPALPQTCYANFSFS